MYLLVGVGERAGEIEPKKKKTPQKAALVFIRVFFSKHNFKENKLVHENKPKVSNAALSPHLRTHA